MRNLKNDFYANCRGNHLFVIAVSPKSQVLSLLFDGENFSDALRTVIRRVGAGAEGGGRGQRDERE